MAVTTITKVGSFTNDLATQLNDNFATLAATSAGGALTDGYILVGSALGVAAGVAMSGDVTILNTGATAIKTSVSLTTPVIGAATGTSLVLSAGMTAAGYTVGATAGATAGPFTSITGIRAVGGIITVLTGS